MGRGGDNTAQQAMQQQRVDQAILQLWTEVGESLNRTQTGESFYVLVIMVSLFVILLFAPPSPELTQ